MAKELKVNEMPEIVELLELNKRITAFLEPLIQFPTIRIEVHYTDWGTVEFVYDNNGNYICAEIGLTTCNYYITMMHVETTVFEGTDTKEMGEMICSELKKLLHA